MRPSIFMSMSVIVGQEYSPRVVFAIIPVVIVPVVAVIDPDLDAGIIRCWGGTIATGAARAAARKSEPM